MKAGPSAAQGGCTDLQRRRWLKWGCAHGAALGAAAACMPAAAQADPAWSPPPRLERPDIASDEGGLWALVDRQEARVRRGAFLLNDPKLREYLKSVACRLGGEHCADTRVYAVRTPWFNASMAPNGMMQIWSGLLLRVENEAQLAAVMGHEIGHYLQRHSVAQLRDIKTRTAFMGLLAFAGGIGLIGQLAMLAGAAAYSREHETEADSIGLHLMRRGGYDPREAAKIWANLRAELSAGAGGDPAKKSVLFASHPPSDERQRKLAEAAGEQGGFIGADEFAAQIDPLMPDLIEDELRRGQHDEAIQLFGRLIARRPQRADLRYARAEARRLRSQDKDLEEAAVDYEQALALERPPPQALRGLGFLRRQQGRKDEAAAYFNRYLEQAPQAPDADLIRSYLQEPSP
jgi:beta-barrel assembly-enhancing protease